MNINKLIQAIQDYQAFINTIQPIFEDYYQQKVEEVNAVKVILEKTFNKGVEAFLLLTNHMIPKA